MLLDEAQYAHPETDHVLPAAPPPARIKRRDRCVECGAYVPPGTGFRVLKSVVYCNEEHAVADQQNSPM